MTAQDARDDDLERRDMARTWQTRIDQAGQPNWWSRHWSNPSFSGSVIGIILVAAVVATALSIGLSALHV